MLRLFVSVDVEDPKVLSAISSLKALVASTGVPQKLVEDENLHVTLAFIGEVPEAEAEEIKAALRTVEHRAFKMHLKGLGAFPSEASPRVVWVGVAEGADELRELHKKVLSALRSVGVQPKDPRFEPHITISRVKGSKGIQSLAKVIASYRDYEVGWVDVKELRLKQSTLTPRGPIYKTLLSVALKT